MTFTPDLTKSTYKCISCELISPYVECGGIYYCPNKLCTVSGASHYKSHLLSYFESNKKIYVNPAEVYHWGLGLIENETDLTMKEAMERSLVRWKDRILPEDEESYDKYKREITINIMES